MLQLDTYDKICVIYNDHMLHEVLVLYVHVELLQSNHFNKSLLNFYHNKKFFNLTIFVTQSPRNVTSVAAKAGESLTLPARLRVVNFRFGLVKILMH